MPHASATIILSDLHAWTYSSELPAGLTKSAGKSGDVLLAAMWGHPFVHRLTRRFHTISATTDHVRCSMPLPRATTTLASEPLALLWPRALLSTPHVVIVLDTSSHPMTWSVHLLFEVFGWILQAQIETQLSFKASPLMSLQNPTITRKNAQLYNLYKTKKKKKNLIFYPPK